MTKVIPINAIRTTEKWLLDNGFQKLRKSIGKDWFKNGELYIEHSYTDNGAAESWYRVIPSKGGNHIEYVGIPDMGYGADYTYKIELFYEHITGTPLIKKQ